ncbi:MAG: ABC transporter ATP-binding protein [Bryobacteraceae bacterium]
MRETLVLRLEKLMLQVDALKKSYGNLVAVNDVSLRAGAGETIGLLGPNGAGKTTIVAMIAGLIRPDSGSVQIEGRPLAGDTDPNKRRIGLVPQELALFDELTARANLELFAALYDLDGSAAKRAIGEALELVGLADRAQERVKNYSGGMKRRLNLAGALLHDPQILLLDEPTVGVDPQSRNAIFDNLEVLKHRGKTLLYTTHYMEEAERLCDRVIIIDHGKVVADDTLQGLYRLLPVTNLLAVELIDGQDGLRVDKLLALPGVRSAKLEAGTLRVGVQDLATETPRVLQWLVERGHLYHHVASERANLETVFLTLTGRSLRDA